MNSPIATETASSSAENASASAAESPVETESLVEEVSIDGMCGVY
ncbi:mycofactocin precursor MftA [Pseudoclavibacter endophyticus]|uniref:Mycofactocin n=1 Tax=Pseudoclavibacter endophyticus TaxID=1778590 RepID=A0A6H9WFI7_9MICO|nr:mycofactocin precursor MftA [Pseudoclavibacter endophyticus]KAB1649662.1 mycofactocin precursor [Pseudoclavibacter endophyticus]